MTGSCSCPPNLFGGGALYGEFDPVGFATVAEALDAPLGPPVAVPDDRDGPDAVDAAFDELDTQRRALTRAHGAALADRLVTLCEDHLAGPATAGKPRAPPAAARDRRPRGAARPDTDARLAAAHAGRRPDEGLDHGTAAAGRRAGRRPSHRRARRRRAGRGVGQKTKVPPRWLREAIWARDTDRARPRRDNPGPARRPRPHRPLARRAGPTASPTSNRSADAGTTTRPRQPGPSTVPATAPYLAAPTAGLDDPAGPAPPRPHRRARPGPAPPAPGPTSNPPDRPRRPSHPDCSVVRGDGAWSPAIDRVHVYDVGGISVNVAADDDAALAWLERP